MHWYFDNYTKDDLDTVLCLNQARASILQSSVDLNMPMFEQPLHKPQPAEVIVAATRDFSVMVEVAISVGTGPRGISGHPVGGWIVVTTFSDNDDLAKTSHQQTWTKIQEIIMAE